MRRLPLVLTAAALTLTACAGQSGPSSAAPASSGRPTASRSAPTSGAAAPTLAPLPSAPRDTPAGTDGTSPAPTSAATPEAMACSALAARLSPEQRVGQLLMIGLDAAWPRTHDDETIAAHHVGNVVYLGGWSSAARVRRASEHLQSLATDATTGGVRMLLAADQEGGQVRQIRDGVSRLPSALQQGTRSPERITDGARTIGRELRDLGVTIDLAPVADTVPDAVGRGNEPIGRWGRQFGNDPQTAARGVEAFTRGLLEAGIGATVKHFPGLGRVRGNTDFTARGITDDQATTDDPHLEPFRRGIDAGAAVMMSSARYPNLDDQNQAVFSPAIVTGLLRERLGYRGLVMTDDLGAAKAVAHVPAGERAVRFVRAGGDLVVTGRPTDAGPMSRALLAAREDPDMARRIDESATRVLAYKARLGLADCR